MLLILIALALAPAAGGAVAQAERPRSDTGRHRPVPVTVPGEETVKARETKAAVPGRWFLGLGAGLKGGGDLWRVETTNGAVVPWQSAVPFSSSRFTATLNNNFGMGLFVGRRLGSQWSVLANLNSSRMDITAEALQGQDGGVFGYDRLTVTTLGLAVEVQLARIASYPYVNAGVVFNRLTATREKELDQNQIGFRLGLGYLRALTPEFSLRAEARYSQSGFDVGTFVPQTTNISQPELDYDPAGDLNVFEVILAVQMNL